MLSEQECSEKLKNGKNKQNCYDYFHINVGDSKKTRQTLSIAVRKPRTIKQNIKLSKEAYDYMIGEDAPNPNLKKKWKKWSINQRLQYHCAQIAESLGAIGFTFEVLDD